MKKLVALLLALAMMLGLMSFASAETVDLLVWVGDDMDQEWIDGVIESFKAAYPDTEYNITVGIESESTCKDTILADPEAAADVFTFAHDQINVLVDAGVLQPVVLDTDAVIEANGGAESGSVLAASVDGTLYAYPATADNGYFMFYNKQYFTEDDVKSFDTMLKIAADNGKYVSMQFTSGWYNFSFFAGAGLTCVRNDDGSNTCNWNATDTPITGAQVAQAMLDIAANPGFINQNDGELQTGFKDGTVIAGINGVWNATVAQEAWGENYAACKLPTYTVAGQQVQMSSMAGYKMVGVNAFCGDKMKHAMMFAEFMTNYDSQVSRFNLRGQGPSNVQAAASEAVQAAPAIAALAAQSPYATAQNVGDNYWAPTEAFGTIIVGGNADGTDLQTLVDNMTIGITALPQ